VGIKNSDDLLHFCRASASVSELARVSGVEPQTLAQLVNRADLARIRGIGETYTKLLEEAGINTITDLAAHSPEDLRQQIVHLNNQRKLVGRVPALAMVTGWVSKARRLPAMQDGATADYNN